MPTPCCPEVVASANLCEGLTEPNRQMVDASCGGTFMMRSEDEA
jgi:hypothetical protein